MEVGGREGAVFWKGKKQHVLEGERRGPAGDECGLGVTGGN